MPLLDKATYDEILDLLYPVTQTDEQRHTLFTQAFMGIKNAPRIDVRAGTQDIALARMVQGLVNFGDIDGQSALWMLLRELKRDNLVGYTQQVHITALELKINVRGLKLSKHIPKSVPHPLRFYVVTIIILGFVGLGLISLLVPQFNEWFFNIWYTLTFRIDCTPFAEGEIGVVLARFGGENEDAETMRSGIVRGFNENNVNFIEIEHPIEEREQAQLVNEKCHSTIVMWGEPRTLGNELIGVEMFYEITPRNERLVFTTVENLAVASDLENFSTYILNGMDSLYIVYFTNGQIHYFEESYEPSLEFFNQTVERIPEGREEDVEAAVLYFYRGTVYLDLGDYERAIADYDRAIELDADFAVAYLNRGAAYNDSGDYERAIADYDRAIQLNNSFTYAYINRGLTYVDSGDYERAIADYDRAIQLDGEYTYAYFYRGTVYLDLGDYERAIADYDRAIQLDGEYAYAYFNRGDAYYGLGDYEQAIADYNRAIQLDANLAEAYLNRGAVYYDLGDYELAIADYDRAIQLDADMAEAYYNRGLTYLNADDYERAIADFDRAIQLDGEYADAYYRRGVTYYYLRDYERAIADFDRAIQLCEVDCHLDYYIRGIAYTYSDDYERAIADFTHTIQLDNDFPQAYHSRCWLRTTELNEHQLALEDCNRAIELLPEYYTFYDSRCWVKKNLGDYEGAIEDCMFALEGLPNAPESHLSLGDVYYALEDYEQALIYYRRYLELAPQDLIDRYNYVSQRIAEMEAALEGE